MRAIKLWIKIVWDLMGTISSIIWKKRSYGGLILAKEEQALFEIVGLMTSNYMSG